VGGDAPPAVRLDPKEHIAYQWVKPKEAIQLLKYPHNQEAVKRACFSSPPLFLHRSGSFFQEGEEVTHERTAALLHKSLVKSGAGYLVRIGAEELDVIVDDTPRFVRGFDAQTGKLSLVHGEEEILDPSTLNIRNDNTVTCTLKDGLGAKFLSPAHYALGECLEEKSPGELELVLQGKRFRIS
jgi:hypothetical protein